MSKTLVKHATRNDYLKPDVDSRVDDFNKKLTERLDNGNSDVGVIFDFVLPYKGLRGNLGVNCASGVTPTDEEYDDMIVKGRQNYKDEVIDKYLNVKLVFDVGTNDERRVTVVKS